MITYDDLRDQTEQEADCIFAHGGQLEYKYGARNIADLEDDGEFLADLALLSLQLAGYGVSAMVASERMGIGLSADPIRVLIAYISADPKFGETVADKAHRTARKLAEAGSLTDASAFEKFVSEFEISVV